MPVIVIGADASGGEAEFLTSGIEGWHRERGRAVGGNIQWIQLDGGGVGFSCSEQRQGSDRDKGKESVEIHLWMHAKNACGAGMRLRARVATAGENQEWRPATFVGAAVDRAVRAR